MIKTAFGDSKASLFKLRNNNNIKLTLTDIGASIVSLTVPTKKTSELDIVLGCDDPDAYYICKSFFGATVGRYANRIGGGTFRLGDKFYELDRNEEGNTLHSGFNPYSNRIWELVISESNNEPGLNGVNDDFVTFRLLSPDGDQGFPGLAEIKVKYTLSQKNEVIIEYYAISDQTTIFNLTNHAYFNLGGHAAGSEAIMNHCLELDSDGFTETDDTHISTGNIIPVAGTPMDFRAGRRIGEGINTEYPTIKARAGYDHNFVINAPSLDKPAARLWYDATGIELQTFTDMPGIQFYSGNFLVQQKGKDSVTYSRNAAVCLETQFYPNSPNIPEFPSCVFPAGEPFISTTIYKIIIKK